MVVKFIPKEKMITLYEFGLKVERVDYFNKHILFSVPLVNYLYNDEWDFSDLIEEAQKVFQYYGYTSSGKLRKKGFRSRISSSIAGMIIKKAYEKEENT